jgi:hypothetical protein
MSQPSEISHLSQLQIRQMSQLQISQLTQMIEQTQVHPFQEAYL